MADRLVADGVLQPAARDKAVDLHLRTQRRIEECLLDLGVLREPELLRFLAARHGTRFVSTEKLSKANLDPATLAKVPRKVAERYLAVPVLFDATKNALSVATPDPDNVDALDQIRKGAGVREVQALVARPAAVEAAIRKFYYNDPLGFAAFELVLGDGAFELGNLVTTGGTEVTTGAYPKVEVAITPGAPEGLEVVPLSTRLGTGNSSPYPVDRTAGSVGPATPGVPTPTRIPKASPMPAQAAPAPTRAPKPPPPPATGLTRVPKPPPVPRATVHAPKAPPALTGIAPARLPKPPRRPHLDEVPRDANLGSLTPVPAGGGQPKPNNGPAVPDLSAVTDQRVMAEPFLETLNVLVSVVENARAELRGHSAQVARLIRKMAERLGLSLPDVNAVVAAAYLHDVGKAGSFHLTPLNVAEYDGPRAAAQKAYANPIRLFQNVKLAPLTVAALQGMYERFDGTGLPDHKPAKEIPLAARLLGIADTFVDLTANPKNPLRRTLKPVEACDVLARYRGTVFDPALVDLLRITVAGDDVRARLLADRPIALLVDPEPEDTMVLELRMAEQGFEVRVARSAEQANKALESGEIELVVAEIDLGGTADDGLSLLRTARKADWGRALPWLILSRREGRADAEAAFSLGVIDYVLKPAPAEVLVAKLKQALDNRAGERAQRGVSGSVSEMGIPDLVQVLFYGRKSGVLRLRRAADSGDLYFRAGLIVHAVWGSLRGEDAFYEMLQLRSGEFSFDPSARAEETTITASPETLLLEGLRRMDER